MLSVRAIIRFTGAIIADVEVDIWVDKILIKGVDGLQGGPCSLIGCE